jgi:regulator of protease activity HflC (stomatin/prohibitin superfamily)
MSWCLDLFPRVFEIIFDYARRHPVETAIAILAFVRLFGTTVDSGSKGVLFVFGRVKKELEPGFHPLIPVVYAVRKTPVRSITLDLPKQRLTTADGLVYDVQANLVYRIALPAVSMVEVKDVRKGIETVVPLIVQDLLRSRTRATLAARVGLEEEFTARAEEMLRRWGVTVEQAGFKSIAPTKKTLRLTQLALLVAERDRAMQDFLRAGVPAEVALTLLGADRHLIGHAAARYRGLRRRATAWPRPIPAPLKPAVNQQDVEASEPAVAEEGAEGEAAATVTSKEPITPRPPRRSVRRSGRLHTLRQPEVTNIQPTRPGDAPD